MLSWLGVQSIGRRRPADGWRSTFYASSVIVSSKSKPIERRKSALLRRSIAKFPRENMSLDPPNSLAVEHLWCIGAYTMISGKVHFMTSTTALSSASNRLASSLLAAMLSVSTCSGTVVLAGRLLTQLLKSRSKKYECTHRERWGKTPTIKISGCHSAILITELDVPASIGEHGDFPP